MSQIFLTSSTSDKRKEQELVKTKRRQEEQYDPTKCSRELNPYWKDGGTGLPTFKKPSDNLNSEYHDSKEKKDYNWKRSKNSSLKTTIEDSESDNYNNKSKDDETHIQEKLTKSDTVPLDPNIIAAKLVKAEIMGNTKLIAELKQKLEDAKQAKIRENEINREIILTQTNVEGDSRPLKIENDEYGSKKKKRKVETHTSKERTSYYADDDKYSLKQMFEAEKYSTSDSVNKEFAKIAGNIRKNDNLADLFVDKIRREGSSSKDVDNAISQHEKINKSLDNCMRCVQNMPKHLMIEHNDNCYLSLPDFEPLTEGHCLINPVRHVSCSVQLDENEWSDINDLRLKLVRIFEQKDKSIVFFEIAKSFKKYPHMVLECIPIPKRKSDLASIYFKKAIEESETEWSHNKKLISLKNKDVRRAVPKGLPYFFVSFGMSQGFAHVIEDQSLFPSNFAQEIIGGMLDIHHSKWRKPKRENFDEQRSRVSVFNKLWRNIHEDSS
ncbi:hypothetical protein HHI36_024363 [Cryptolaemus montrouzieri]|uniref:CWF19-like protein 2 n=1 Tax=Cryptolaemus montrouzieri TaxID=559131 RepID=A0ABD2MVH5_9CUCU